MNDDSKEYKPRIGYKSTDSIEPKTELSIEEYHQLLYRYLSEVQFDFPTQTHLNAVLEAQHRKQLADALRKKGVLIKL